MCKNRDDDGGWGWGGGKFFTLHLFQVQVSSRSTVDESNFLSVLGTRSATRLGYSFHENEILWGRAALLCSSALLPQVQHVSSVITEGSGDPFFPSRSTPLIACPPLGISVLAITH